jgi:hypothetical protein
MSQALMKIMLVEYLVILAACLGERNWPRALYWLGATVLQVSVLWGMR